MPRMKKPGQNKVVTIVAPPVEVVPVETNTAEMSTDTIVETAQAIGELVGEAAVPAPVKTKTKKVKAPKKDTSGDFYEKYSHVVRGSVREPTKDDLKQVTKSHGKVCEVKCVDCKKVFVVNTQDAFQSLRCPDCKAEHTKKRRAERRAKRSKKSK